MLDLGGGGSTANQTTITASGSGRVVSGKGANVAESGSLLIGAKGNYREAGSFGDKNTLNTGTQLSNTGTGSVAYNYTSSDPDVLKAALASIGATSQQFTGTVGDLVKSANARAASSESASMNKLTELALSAQTGGKSQDNKTVLYVVGAIIVGVVLLGLAYVFKGK